MFRINSDNKPVNLPGIYVIINLITEAKYVGQTKDFIKRYKRGKYQISSDRLKIDVEKHGSHSFEFQPYFIVFDTKDLIEFETQIINEINATNNAPITEKQWITDGNTFRKVPVGKTIPVGWEPGRGVVGTTIAALGGSKSAGKIWIHNDFERKRVLPNQIPEGWKKGRGEIGKTIAINARAARVESIETNKRVSVGVTKSWELRRQQKRIRLRVRLND